MAILKERGSMPIKPCKDKDKPGKKYGERGKCYTGEQAVFKASKQAAAIHAEQARAKGKGRPSPKVQAKARAKQRKAK